jgi:diguanylate cyclase (GGDEF)-like protein/PAS domain S-box-containing protein
MSPQETRKPPLILIAAADEPTLKLLRETLSQVGFATEAIDSRSAFLHALERRSPVLAIVDSRIPGGFEWCSAVPRDTHGTVTPILMLAEPNEVAHVHEAGAIDFAAHPLRKDLLVHRVRHALRTQGTLEELDRNRRALDSTQRLSSIGTWTITLENDLLTCSAEAQRIFGWKLTSMKPHKRADIVALVNEKHLTRVRDWFETACSGEACPPIEHKILLPDGSERHVRQHVAGVERREGKPTHVCGLVHDLTYQSAPDEQGNALAHVDGLSGLPNQEHFVELLSRVIGQAQPPHDEVAVLCVGLGLERVLNELPGSRDVCLSAMVQRMRASVRDRDTLSYLGNRVRDVSLAHIGEEVFTILLPGLLRALDAYKVARRVREKLIAPLVIDGHEVVVQASVGISIYPSDTLGPETLVRASETAMHAASKDEPNCVHFFTSSMNASALERLTIETNLRTALEREELLVCYQPKIDIASGKIVGVEALLRWEHPELGMVSPAQFIPIAEETGLIMPIGEYVLRVACEQNKKWQDEGHEPIRMAVNLSTVQFRDPQLHKVVTRVLRQTGLAPEWLELELTESILLHKADATIATLRSLKEMGVHLAIDDFGTGYSSLSYLKRFPIDSLKIDQSFIREVTTNPEDAAITTSIILMGRSLRLRVVAEGVESHSQLAFLKVLECDEAQGYLFSRPVPAHEVVKLFGTRYLETQRR